MSELAHTQGLQKLRGTREFIRDIDARIKEMSA